jgi:hypothetical protein
MKFNLVLCELHLPSMHGKTNNSCPIIESHFLLIDKFDGLTGVLLDEYNGYNGYATDSDHESFASDLDEDIDPADDDASDDNNPNYINSLKAIQQLYSIEYENMRSISHPIIRNYSNIIRRANYIKPEIGLCIELHTHEQIVIIKTIWLKIIQRKWKKVFAERKRLLKERCLPGALYSRMMTGKWPAHCLVLPGLNGMLSDLL